MASFSSNSISPPSFTHITQIVLFVVHIEEVGLSCYHLYTQLKEILSHLNLNSSSSSNVLQFPKKTLKLTLTDASRARTYIAFEHSPIEWLQLNLPIGSKLRIKSTKMFQNTLFLSPNNTTLVIQGPERVFKEWLEELISTFQQRLKISHTSSPSSSSLSDMNTRVDSQAHRFLLDPPHPDELITSEVTLPTLSMPSTSHPIPQPSPHIRSTSTEITSNSVSYLSSPPRSNMEIVDDWADIDWSETNLTHLIDPGPPKLSLQELVTTPFVIVQVMARISKTGTKVFRHPETHALSIVVTLEDATGKEVVRFDTSKYKDILSQNPRDPQFMIQLKSILKQHVHDSVLCLEKINGQWTWV